MSSPDLLTVSTTTSTPHQHQHLQQQQQQQQQHILQQQHYQHRTTLLQQQQQQQQQMPSPELTYREMSVDGFALPHGSFTSLQAPHPPTASLEGQQQQQQPFPPQSLRNSLFEGHPFDFGGMAAAQQDHGMQQQQLALSPSLTATVPHSISAPDLLAAQFEQSLHISSSQSSSQHTTSHHLSQNHHHHHPHNLPHHEYDTNAPSLVPQAPILIAPGCYTAQVLVPDSMIGSILGRGGRTLNELQMMSGTRIRISQRGEYMPGTRSRIVGIRGTTAQAVWDVQYMINQRMVLPPTATTSAATAYHMPASVSFDNLSQLAGRTSMVAEDGTTRGLHQ
jgi:KH domain